MASNVRRRSQPPCSTKPSQTQFFCYTSQLLPLSCLTCLQSWSATGANWLGQTAFGGATHPNQAVQGTATLNPCSNGAPTAGHLARCDNARNIFASPGVQRRHVTRSDRAWECRFSFGCATSFGWPESVAHPQSVVLYASEGLARLFQIVSVWTCSRVSICCGSSGLVLQNFRLTAPHSVRPPIHSIECPGPDLGL